VELEKYFTIEKTKLIAKTDLSITIDRKDYKEELFGEFGDHFYLPGILEVNVLSENKIVPIVVNYNVKLHKTEDITEINPSILTINYVEGEVVISQETYEANNTDMTLLVSLFQGRVKHIKDPAVLVNAISSMLSIDQVYIELVVSNMFRNESGVLARMKGNYADAEILSQNKIARTDSWMSALSYGYLDSGLEKGLVGDQESENNPIEKVLNFNL